MQEQQHKIRNMDRFSTLPDEIAHRILEFVSPKEIYRLSLVSKRCEQLCLSTPFLHVNDICVRNNSLKRAQFMNYIERVLCRRSARGVPVFRFNWSELSDEQEEYRFLSWIHRAVLFHGVRELRLSVANLRDGSVFVLPSASILSSTLLEMLDLSFQGGRGIAAFKILPIDLGRPFSSLKSLSLRSVRIDQSLFIWISQCCKCLSSLTLDSTDGTNDITVTSSSLNKLSLYYLHKCINLQIYAENLEVLNIVMLTTDLVQAIDLITQKPRIRHQILLKRFVSGNIRLAEVRNTLDDVYDRLQVNLVMREFATRLSILTMFGDTIEDMYMQQLLPINMPNLRNMKLQMNRASNTDLVSLMAALLKGTPKLKIIYIAFRHRLTKGDVEVVQRGPQQLKRFLEPKLTHVDLWFPYGVEKRKLEVIKYFINSAAEKICIQSAAPLPLDLLYQIKECEMKSSSKAEVQLDYYY